MEQIQHVGILVSRANGCAYCTGAFCTILNHGLNESEKYVKELVDSGINAVQESKLKLILILDFALKVNDDPKSVTDEDVHALKNEDYTDKGLVQLVHLVSNLLRITS